MDEVPVRRERARATRSNSVSHAEMFSTTAWYLGVITIRNDRDSEVLKTSDTLGDPGPTPNG